MHGWLAALRDYGFAEEDPLVLHQLMQKDSSWRDVGFKARVPPSDTDWFGLGMEVSDRAR